MSNNNDILRVTTHNNRIFTNRFDACYRTTVDYARKNQTVFLCAHAFPGVVGQFGRGLWNILVLKIPTGTKNSGNSALKKRI